MLFPSVCRVCLSSNRQMKIIANTQLQTLFERITTNELITTDGRPESVCYLCYLLLQKCWKFAEMARRANLFLTSFLDSGVQLTERNLINNCSVLRHNTSPDLSSTCTTFVSIPFKTETEESIKVENEIENDDNDVTLPDTENNIKPEEYEDNKNIHTNNPDSLDVVKDEYNSDTPITHFNEDSVKEAKLETIDNPTKCNRKNKPIFKCNKCPKAFRQKAYFKTHLRIHTGEKPYTCNLCDDAFTASTSLKLHVRMHNGEAPFICHTCSKTFKSKPHLKEHFKTHTGEKPHTCTECSDSFAHANSLKRHMRIHSGEKPYMCEICSRRFTQISNLRKHGRSCNKSKKNNAGQSTHHPLAPR